jgi:hypothetical protein
MDNQLAEKLSLAMERTAAAVERLAAAMEGRDVQPPRLASGLGPATLRPTHARVAKRRGRPPDTDADRDRHICEHWKASGYVKYEDFARKNGHKTSEVKKAVDRNRHRKK